MNKPLLWLVALSSLTACAGQKYRVDVGPFFARARGDVALQDAGGSLQLGQVQNDLDGNLGLGETEPSPYLRGQWERDRHRVRLHGFGIDSEGAGTLAGNYGGILGNSLVTSELTFLSIAANYGYEVLRGPRHRVAVGGQVGFYSLDVEARSTPQFESVETDALVPMPFAEAEALLGKFTLGANFAWMSASLGDASGIYLDAEAYARWSAAPDFDFFAGYRFVSLDAAGKATSRDFDADVDVQGFFFGAGIRF